MNRGLPTVFSACLLFLAAGSVAAATSKEASREIEAKVALESSLEKRLQSVLKEALGSDDLIVIVNVTLRSEANQEDPEVMPGVPVKQAQSADALAEAAGATSPMVSRISATVMVDEALEAKDVDLVTKVATGILAISPTRGDTLNVEKIKFHKPRVQNDPLRYTGVAGTALWLIFAVILAIVLQRKFLGPLITNLRDLSTAALLRERDGERTKPGEAQSADAEAPETAAAASAPAGGARADQPFSFVDRGDLPKLIHILRHSSAADAATTIQYLPSDIAAKAIAELEPEARQEVIARLSKVTQLDASQVRPMEQSLRERIDFLIGGEDKVVELLDVLPAAMQADLLAALRADNPDMAAAVSRRLVSIDDLASLEPAEIKLLSRRVPAKLLAILMKSSTALRDSVLPKLARGTREWLTQEIEFSQEPTADALESARRPVLAAISQLVREGRIVLKKKTSSAPPPRVAEAPPAALSYAAEPVEPASSFATESAELSPASLYDSMKPVTPAVVAPIEVLSSAPAEPMDAPPAYVFDLPEAPPAPVAEATEPAPTPITEEVEPISSAPAEPMDAPPAFVFELPEAAPAPFAEATEPAPIPIAEAAVEPAIDAKDPAPPPVTERLEIFPRPLPGQEG